MSRRIVTPLTAVALFAILLTSAAASSGTAPGQQPPVSSTPPAISGTPEVGDSLSTSTGTWDGKGLKYAFQWLRCDSTGGTCTAVAGPTTSSYSLVANDVGYTFRAVVTASNRVGSAAATSDATAAVPTPTETAPPPPPPSASPSVTSLPTISGTAQQGQTLTGSSGTWSGTTPMTYTYQWQRCDSAGNSCSPIQGATGATYALVSTDVGATMRLSVTTTNSTGSATASSAPTAVVSPSAVTLYTKNWEDGLVDSGGWGHQASDTLGTSPVNGIVYGTIAADTATSDLGSLSGRFSVPASSYKQAAMMLHNRTVLNGSDEWFSMAYYFPSGWPSALTGSDGTKHSLNVGCPNYYSVNSCMVSVSARPDSMFTLINSGDCPASGTGSGCPWYSATPDGGNYSVCRGFTGSQCGPHYIIPPGQLTLNVWHEIIMHVYYTLDNTGAVEFWHRVKGQSSWTKAVTVAGGFPTLQTGPTAFGTTVTTTNINGWKSTDQFGLYRTIAETDPATMWADDVCRGSTFDAVAACLG